MIYIERENIDLASKWDALWTQTAQAALDIAPEFAASDLTIVFVNDDDIRELNKTYRNIDSPTDVLSFSSEEMDPETGSFYLGDLVISVPRATEQAQKAGHPVENEIRLLIVHGVLHLLGYDHATSEDKKIMWEKQTSILKSLGCEILALPESD